MRLLLQIGLVASGSALGGVARWGVATAVARLLGTPFPFGTLLINLTGSLFLGWFATVLSERLVPGQSHWLRPDDLRLLIAVGFPGAYTTFSTLEYEAHALLRDGDGWAALAYLAGSLSLGLLAVRLGVLLARWGELP